MKWLYKYPQRAYPYVDLVDDQRRRCREDFEYELLDTGVFADDRYFDVSSSTPRRRPRTFSSASRSTNRGPSGDAPRAAYAVVPQHVELLARTPAMPHLAAAGPTARASWRLITSWVSAGSTRWRPRCSSPRTRPTPSGCSARRTRALRQGRGSTTTSCTAHVRRSTRRPARKRRPTSALDSRAGGRRRSCGCGSRPMRRPRASVADFDQTFDCASSRG